MNSLLEEASILIFLSIQNKTEKKSLQNKPVIFGEGFNKSYMARFSNQDWGEGVEHTWYFLGGQIF